MKKPVVGRGNLPPDALEILMKEARESSEGGIHENHLSQSADRLIVDELDNGIISLSLSFVSRSRSTLLLDLNTQHNFSGLNKKWEHFR